MEPKLIERINELARKKKSVGLTAEEQKEQANLRNKYLKIFRESVRQQLDRIEIVDDDSSIKQ
ncbi:DUF896 domain-containing protein [Marinicrinis lubricantis]|uniref:UPF0291 protein ACFPXP_18465 n=1 Tax=Marinicrinis lubricantis TaxID=2086470 RepID=A0ABW1ITI9_9BACL